MQSAEADATASSYVIPRYRAGADPSWFHALLGTVPGHQIDFIYAPEVPQGQLEHGHLGHLWRLMKYIEPRASARYAFALGNLSRDDVGYEPGHGGFAILFALRVGGVIDHADRAMPPYAHSVLSIDRALDYATMLEAISVFYRRFLEGSSRAGDTDGAFYRTYFEMVQKEPEKVVPFLDDYVANFDELPQVPRSRLGLEWEANEDLVPKRVTIVHADDEPFGNIAHTAATLGSMLYRSNIKWTTITSGREIEIPGGVSIRFVPASEAPRVDRPNPRELRRTAQQDLRLAAARDPKGLQLSLDDLPSDEAALAHLLFGAKRPGPDERDARAERRLARGHDATATSSNPVPSAAGPSNRPPPIRSSPPAAAEPSSYDSTDVSFEEAPTLMAPLEADPAPALAPAPAVPFDPRRSSSTKGVPSAFDPRRSSPTGGVPSAFDPRRSSPTTGVAAVQAPAVSTPVSVPVVSAAVVASLPGPSVPRLDSPPPPSLESGPRSALTSDPGAGTKSRLGLWIGVGGGLAVIVAIVVAVAAGGGDGSATPTGTPDATSTGGPGVSAPVPATPSQTASVATTAPAASIVSSAPSAADPPAVSATSRPSGSSSKSGGSGKSSGGTKVSSPGTSQAGKSPQITPNMGLAPNGK